MRARELIQRLEDAEAHDHSDAHGTYLILEPDDLYDVRDLIDEGLAARESLLLPIDLADEGLGAAAYFADEFDNRDLLDKVTALRDLLDEERPR